LEQATITHEDSATQVWLGEALAYARSNGQTKVIGYLEAVLDDAVFEKESVAWRQLLSKSCTGD
jgi:hypothetical protein